MQVNCGKISPRRGTHSGFTLIELLVVIAIIAILAAILLPVLNRAKLRGQQSRCWSNQHQLVAASIMYADDNNDTIIPMDSVYNPPTIWQYRGGFWGGPAQSFVWGFNVQNYVQEAEAVLQTNNPLFKYAQNVGAFECPGDTRYQQPSLAAGWAYGSYSKSQNYAGESYTQSGAAYWGCGNTCKKLADMRNPAETFAFEEDTDIGDPSVGFNKGTWCLAWSLTGGGSFTLQDPIAMYHGDVNTFSYGDGHAAGHRWHDGQLIAAGLAAANGHEQNPTPPFKPAPFYTSADYGFIFNNYRFPGWPGHNP